jgi:adenosylmethionine-8-amino-7-oxononanoate aminotransferase
MADDTVTFEQLERWDREHVWHAFTQMSEYEPLVLDRAEGCRLYDIQGREYLDGVSSLWCNIHGHRHPEIDAAIRAQLDRVAHTTLLGASNPMTIRLARRLVELAPPGLNRVFFSDSGATAVEVAIKLAFQYWRQCAKPQPERACYAALVEGYHGDTLGSVSVGGVARFHQMFGPLLFETVQVPAPNMYRLPEGVTHDTALAYYLDQAELVLRQHHARLAAFVVEPLVQAAAGMLMHPPGYFRGLRELTRRYGVLLIADEVAVGFGRTGKMFACEHEGVTPDLLCLAKGLTGGYLPVAATLATDEIWTAFLGTYSQSRTFFHGHTYGGNPLGCAAALASLDIFEQERTLDNLPPKIDRLAGHLERIGRHPHVGNVRQRGLIAAIELVRDRVTRAPFDWSEQRGMAVCRHARSEGVLLRPLGNVVVIMPPLSITLDELDRIAMAVERGTIAAMAEP